MLRFWLWWLGTSAICATAVALVRTVHPGPLELAAVGGCYALVPWTMLAMPSGARARWWWAVLLLTYMLQTVGTYTALNATMPVQGDTTGPFLFAALGGPIITALSGAAALFLAPHLNRSALPMKQRSLPVRKPCG
jgi:hypothetical protein